MTTRKLQPILRTALPLLLLASAALADGGRVIGVAVGEVFEFETAANGEVAAPAATMSTSQGRNMIAPLPNGQVAKVVGEEPCAESTCLIIEVEQSLPPFIPQLSDKDFSKRVQAKVDVYSGDVFDVRTTMVMGNSVSESQQDAYARESTLGEFFGPWMADIEDGYSQSFERLGGELRTIKVTGRENIAGRDCLVVDRIRALPTGQSIEARLWIDAERRVALKVEQGAQTMTVVSKGG